MQTQHTKSRPSDIPLQIT